jgi:hypothetical protein
VVPDFAADNEVRKQYHAVAKTLLIAAIAGALRQMRGYLIQRSPPPPRPGPDDEAPRRVVHEGTDPRAYMGVNPILRQALRQFVEREKAGN